MKMKFLLLNKHVCKRGLLLLAVLTGTVNMMAQTSTYETSIIQEKDTVWGFGVSGINLYERKMYRMDISYMSKDPEGNPCRLSGVIIIPRDVLDGEQMCDGIVLYNHFTHMAKTEAPSSGNALGEDLVLANPLSPNYIMVIPDYYGFGITEDKEQWYCFGDANGHASIDCLLAAKELLTERGIPQGKYIVNAGYSSGGYDAIAAQKVRDMEYKDKVSFDKTVVGGLPFDLSEAYNAFVSKKDQFWRVFGLLMIVDSYNRHENLGFTPAQMLKSPYAEKFDDWVHSGNYTTADIMLEVQGKNISDVVQEPFLTYNSDEYKKLCEAFDKHALMNDWEPDPTQKYGVFHFYKDTTVPSSSGIKLLNFLSGYKYQDGRENPFRKSIIPEQTHLSTNFVLPIKDHAPLGGIAYFIGLTAELVALPVLYYDDELNTHYADLIKDLTPMGLVKMLDEKYDLRTLIKERMADGGSTDIFSLLMKIMNTVNGYLEPYELEFNDLMTMADASGLSLNDIIEIYNYLTTEPDPQTARQRAATRVNADEPLMTPFLTDYYVDYLNKWYTNKTK